MAIGPDVCEAAVLLAAARPDSPGAAAVLRALTFGDPARATRRALSRTYLAGWLLVFAGALLRKLCYVRLGRLFIQSTRTLLRRRCAWRTPESVSSMRSKTGSTRSRRKDLHRFRGFFC